MKCTNPKTAILTNQFTAYHNGDLVHLKSFVKIIAPQEFELGKKREEIAKINAKYSIQTTQEHIFLPCRKCIGCIINKANDWATRSFIEASAWQKNCFLTLTYDEEHLPKGRNLKKEDMQKFFKRLRKNHGGYETWNYKGKIQKPIRYFYAGEYGPKTLRPHYHAGVFNYWPADAKIFKKSENGDYYYTSEELNRIWGKGYVLIGAMEYASACYIARYTMKKLKDIKEHEQKNWELEEETTGDEIDFLQQYFGEKIEQPKNTVPEFIETSRRGGIGLAGWLIDQEKFKKNMGVFIKDKKSGNAILKKLPLFLKQKWAAVERENYITASESERERLAILNVKADWEKIDQIEEMQLKRANRLVRTNI